MKQIVKVKRILVISLLAMIALNVTAKDELQIVPFVTVAGLSDENDDAYMDLYLVNESFDVANLQFDILFPEGMEYADYYECADRIPHKKTNYDFSFQTAVQSSGYTRFMGVPGGQLRPIPTGEGTIIRINFSTAANMKPGIYPILIENVKLVKTVTESIYLPSSVSYVVIAKDDNSNPLAKGAHVDLSGMTGYIPSFVVNQLNTDIASNTNLRSLNLSGTTFANLGATLSVPNNDNLLWYTSDKASLNRTFTADKWTSICLPVTLEVSSLVGTPVVKKMESYDATEGSITLADVTTMEKGKPYMIKSVSNSQLFGDVTISASESATETEAGSFVSGKMSMKGTYQYLEVSSTASKTYYGFSNGKFVGVTVGGVGKVQPFRAYLELDDAAGSRSISIEGEGTTSIDDIIEDDQSDSPIYNLQGVKMDNGYRAKGVYIRNGKKEIYK